VSGALVCSLMASSRVTATPPTGAAAGDKGFFGSRTHCCQTFAYVFLVFSSPSSSCTSCAHLPASPRPSLPPGLPGRRRYRRAHFRHCRWTSVRIDRLRWREIRVSLRPRVCPHTLVNIYLLGPFVVFTHTQMENGDK
jgi:hypothetical protein